MPSMPMRMDLVESSNVNWMVQANTEKL